MGLMDRMRAGTDSFLIQALFVVIVISFVFWGIGNQGASSYAKAEVDGSRITDTEFDFEMRQRARSAGRTLTDEEYAQLARDTLTGMIQKRVLVNEAERIGLEVSDDEVKRTIYQIPVFQTEEGKFSKTRYENFLKGYQQSDAAFRGEIYEQLLIQKLQNLAFMSVHVTEADVEELLAQQGSSVGVTYVRVPDAAFLPEVEVSDEEVAALVADAPDRIQASYDAQFERRFDEPRKVTLRRILLRTDMDGLSTPEEVTGKMDLVLAELDGGADFGETARKWSESLTAGEGGLLGTQAEDQLDPTVAAAVFAVAPGSRTGVIESSQGLQVFFVEEVIDAKVTTYEEVEATLAREILQEDRAPELAQAYAEGLLASWQETGAPPLEELLTRGFLPSNESELKLSSPGPRELGPAPELMAALQEARTGDLLGQVFEVRGQRVIVQVNNRQDMTLEALGDQKDMLMYQARVAKQQEFWVGYVDALVAAADVVRHDQAQTTE